MLARTWKPKSVTVTPNELRHDAADAIKKASYVSSNLRLASPSSLGVALGPFGCPVGFHRYKSDFLYCISAVERNEVYVLNPARVPL